MTELALDLFRTQLAAPPAASTQLVADMPTPAVLEVAPRGAALAVQVMRGAVLLAPAAQGPMGPSAVVSIDLPFVTADALSGHRAVYVRHDGSLAYASADLADSLDAVVGITTGAAAAGAEISVRIEGEMVEPSWAWTPGPVWLGLGGTLTQADPAQGVALLIGIALGATRLLIDPEPAFRPGP